MVNFNYVFARFNVSNIKTAVGRRNRVTDLFQIFAVFQTDSYPSKRLAAFPRFTGIHEAGNSNYRCYSKIYVSQSTRNKMCRLNSMSSGVDGWNGFLVVKDACIFGLA